MLLLKVLWAACLFNVWLVSCTQVPLVTFQNAANSFSLDLLKELSGNATGNLIFAPISVSTLLAVVQQGARNNSARQLESVLRLSKEVSKLLYGWLSITIKLARYNSTTLEMANCVFVRQGLVLMEDFQNTVRVEFHSKVQPANFGSGEDLVAINSCVSEATHGRIPTILDSALQPDTAMVLVDAVYFNSSWLYKFKRWDTFDRNFYRSSGSQVAVPTMRIDHIFNAGENSALDFKWVELPFHLGLTDIFNQALSDLRGITPSGNLVVSKAVQKADIEVTEDGATAAAATGVVLVPLKGILLRDPFIITADHPFLAMIIDARKLINFCAIGADPSV